MLFESKELCPFVKPAGKPIPITDPNEELPETPPGSPGSPGRRKGAAKHDAHQHAVPASPASQLRKVTNAGNAEPTNGTAEICQTDDDDEPVGISVDRFSRNSSTSIFPRSKGKSSQPLSSSTMSSVRHSGRRRRSSHTKFEAWRLENDLEDDELRQVREVTTSICNERASSQQSRKPRRSIELTALSVSVVQQDRQQSSLPYTHGADLVSSGADSEQVVSLSESSLSESSRLCFDQDGGDAYMDTARDNYSSGVGAGSMGGSKGSKRLPTNRAETAEDGISNRRGDTPKPCIQRPPIRTSESENADDGDDGSGREHPRRRTYGANLLKNLALATRRASLLPTNHVPDAEAVGEGDTSAVVEQSYDHHESKHSTRHKNHHGKSADSELQQQTLEKLLLKSKDSVNSKARRDQMRRQLWNNMRASPDSPLISNRRPLAHRGSDTSGGLGGGLSDEDEWSLEVGDSTVNTSTSSVDTLEKPALQRLARDLIRDNACKDRAMECLSVELVAAREHARENSDLRDALAEQRAWHNRLLLHVLEECPDILTRIND